MQELFSNNAQLIVFLHILSAIIWVGGMIAIRVAVHPTMQSIENPQVKLGKTLEIMGRLFNLVIPFILLLLVTAIIMAIGLNFKGTNLYTTVLIKEGIWTVMSINFIYMYSKRAKAQKLFNEGALPKAKEQVNKIPNFLLPLNIALGIVALYLGVVLRGL